MLGCMDTCLNPNRGQQIRIASRLAGINSQSSVGHSADAPTSVNIQACQPSQHRVLKETSNNTILSTGTPSFHDCINQIIKLRACVGKSGGTIHITI